MAHILPKLHFEKTALEPYISSQTLDFHYDKHHQTYVNKLNTLIENTPFAQQDLVSIIKQSKGSIFNNSAQVWNHSFYWNCLSPNFNQEPTAFLSELITRDFDSFVKFKEQFNQIALNTFGSGWTWLVLDANRKLKILSTSNAETPLTMKDTYPLLTCDVWEHAYYLDTQNNRAQYLKNFWIVANWDFALQNLKMHI